MSPPLAYENAYVFGLLARRSAIVGKVKAPLPAPLRK
jgi:hypothetical protein